jgi:mannose-1-phosphate guanylyltransferase
MKAFLLAAGYGTRLKPLTDHTPKCLLSIDGKPLLYHWLDLIEENGIEEVLINTHHLHSQVVNAISIRKNKVKIKFFHEIKLLGSAGTIKKNKFFIKGEENFFILYADNLTNVSLKEILDFHRKKNSLFTVYVYETNIPKQKGIFEMESKTGKVVSFKEKPENPKSNIANSGIGVLSKNIYEYMPEKFPLDFGKDIMPLIIDKMFIKKTDDYIKDIGSIKDYQTAQKEWRLIDKK